MNDLDRYFAKYFLNAEQFAASCHVTNRELLDLIEDQLILRPSYIVSASSVRSFVFGEMPAAGAKQGEYFHPSMKVWTERAQQVLADVGRRAAYGILKQRFATNMQAALAELNAKTWRLRDCFRDDGVVLDAGLCARIESLWNQFLHGTFGLCVANPTSEAAIARKEVLQEKLIALSDNGTKTMFSKMEANALRDLIATYAINTMPFSPIEYPISSRRRLVADLMARIR